MSVKCILIEQKTSGKFYNNNLLDNWYFADSVNQRDGRFIPPGTTYYSDVALTVEAGITAEYFKVSPFGNVYIIDGNNPPLYVPSSVVQKGYIGPGYTIDRWETMDVSGKLVCSVVDDGIRLSLPSDASDQAFWTQSPESYPTNTLTASILLRDLVGDVRLYLGNNGVIAESDGVASVSGSIAGDLAFFRVVLQPGSSCVIKAAKLELGPVQTLTQQDATGNWLQNDPPPNKALELAKCQRYQLRLGNGGRYPGTISGSGNAGVFFVPTPVTMRIPPTVTHADLVVVYDGTTTQITTLTGVELSKNGIDFVFPNPGLPTKAQFTVYSNIKWLLDANL